MEKIKLTQTVQKGGCAAKVAASELRQILGQVQFPPIDANVLVDGGLFDDAAIYKIPKSLPGFTNSDFALVQTLDFFTPIVDSPDLFGQVATANALSDVYAMGGLPKTAMAILAFPLASLDSSIIVEVLQGASNKMREAQVNFVGGHSIDDDTLKFGLSVTGFVPLDAVWSNAGARAGDHLILTKALGTGTAMAALKQGLLAEADLQEVLNSMTQLNAISEELTPDLRGHIHAATDITGFGLMGHALQMAQASRKQIVFSGSSLPIFESAKWALRQGCLTKAHRTNAEYTQNFARYSEGLKNQDLFKMLFDPQTSGGLLLSVSAESSTEIVKKLKSRFPWTRIIGDVRASGSPDCAIQVESSIVG